MPEFFPQYPVRPSVEDPVIQRLDKIISDALRAGDSLNPFVVDYFKDPDFYNALPEDIKKSDPVLRELMVNMSRFNTIISVERRKRSSGDTSGLLGEEMQLGETEHADGRVRRAEVGYKINLEYLRNQGINPKQVLFFRTTQPSIEPKPEYYWTSDYFETRRGLRQEIPTKLRKTAVTLISDLETINQNGGLITDINDDSGLAVRQIGTGPFDQSLVLATIKAKG